MMLRHTFCQDDSWFLTLDTFVPLQERNLYLCMQRSDVACRGEHAIRRFLLLAGSVLAVVAASFGPFIAYGQLKQVSD